MISSCRSCCGRRSARSDRAIGRHRLGRAAGAARRDLVVLFLGYAYIQGDQRGGALASLGLLSFAAVAQIAPAFLGGLFWRRANARGAMAGLIVGSLIWLYTLFLPSLEINAAFADFLNMGRWRSPGCGRRLCSPGRPNPLVNGATLSLARQYRSPSSPSR